MSLERFSEAKRYGRNLPGDLPSKFATWYEATAFTNPGAALLVWWPMVTPECFAVKVRAKEWARFPEVLDYAAERGVSIEEAIIELVNSGLSHRPAEVTQ